MSGLMVALSWIRVFLHLELGSLLTSLRTAGVVVGGVMLIVFALRVKFSLVEVSAPFLGLSSPSRELRCGVPFWLCSLLERFTWVLTILVSFVMSGVFLMVIMVLFPFELHLLVEKMLHLSGLDTVQITEVKGHADEGMVLDGRVREFDRLGKDAADEAADVGRRRVGNAVIDARRNLSGVLWSLVPCCS